MRELKRDLVLEDIRGNRELAYTLLEASHPLFLDVTLSQNEDGITLESTSFDGMYGWDKLSAMTEEERLRHLINLGQVYHQLKHSKYSYDLTPENIVFTRNGLPLFIERGIVDQVPPYEAMTEETFSPSYKAMIISLLDKRADYDALMAGKLEFYKGKLFSETINKQTTVDAILDLLNEKFEKEKKNNQEHYSRVSNNTLTRLKIASIVSAILGVLSLLGVLYFVFFAIPKQETVSELRLAFINQDYSRVITAIKNTDSRSLTQDDKYVVAYSVIMTEPLTEEQKEELSKISTQSNEDYLRYWILIGQANIDEAIDIASFLDDPQLLMYGMTKKIDEIQRNPNLNSEERTQQINSYKSKLDELKKTYLTFDSEEDDETTSDDSATNNANTDKN
ncbi:type VII secretion protein EssB [Streptococcus marimammalium]|uniref:type VII secretion protein EssB n=1 Tax=Streptococcus marimammalium TaxID=269666 RepID=UPI0003671909|nr:type VII secretion protein EssB [Streptococcus marimammalium]